MVLSVRVGNQVPGSLGSLLKSSDDGLRVLKHFEFCKSTLL